MNWSSDYRYKILSHKTSFEGEELCVFELADAETYTEKKKGTIAQQKTIELTNSENPDATQTRAVQFGNQKAMYPEAWNHNFGMPVEEHKQALHIDTISGYDLVDNNV